MNIQLHAIDFAAMSPLLILLAGALTILLIESFAEIFSKKYAASITCLFLVLALVASIPPITSQNPLLLPWLRFDALARFFTCFFILIGLASTLISIPFFNQVDASRGEYYFLLLASVIGLVFIGMAADFLMLFLGLETLSISLYILCGYVKKWSFSHEAAMKYFLLGALAAAILLYGIALIYGAIGTTRFSDLLQGYHSISSAQKQIVFFTGIAFVTIGLAFKAAIVPFHTWAPDVYDGAPTPVTAFMAVGTKVGAFAALTIVFLIFLPNFDPIWNQSIALLAYPTIIYANIVALSQTQLRRFFAYSGISHAGFLLIPFAAGTDDALYALLFYLVIYAIATLGCFSVISLIDKSSSGVFMNDLRGLFKRSPFLACVLTLCLLTLAGIPPTAGFLAKFYVFKVAFHAGYYGLVIVGLLMTVVSIFYYTRMVILMLSDEMAITAEPQRSWPVTTLGTISLIAIVVLSCFPFF